MVGGRGFVMVSRHFGPRHLGISAGAEVSGHRHFGTSAELSEHIGTSDEMSYGHFITKEDTVTLWDDCH